MAAVGVGSFCTSVLCTADPTASAVFYAALVGWTIQQVTDTHWLVLFNGRVVASIQASAGRSTGMWIPHVLVDDVNRVADAAVAAGGALVDRVDVKNVARLATIRDLEGAEFGLWEAAPHRGAEVQDETGSLWWIEVLSLNASQCRSFYGRLFDWTTVDTSFEPFEVYTVFKRGETQEGGLLHMDEEWGLAPRWNSIFAVSDCDDVIRRGESLGGRVEFVHTVPKHGRIGSITDLSGAVFVARGPHRVAPP